MKSIALFLLNRALSLLLGELWLFLKEAVSIMESTELTGPQKRFQAGEAALHHAQEAGITLGQSLINLGVEAAVQYVRAKGTPDAS